MTDDVKKTNLTVKELQDTAYKTCVEFAFGPFKVRGNYSDIGDIKEDTQLYQDGFREMQTIQDIQNRSTRAVLLYHKDEGKDVAIFIPDKFLSWMWRSVVKNMIIIIDGMHLIDTGNGLITQNTPNHLAGHSPSSIPKPYALTYPIFGQELTDIMPQYNCAVDTINFLINYYMNRRVQLKDSTNPYLLGRIVQTFVPPSKSIIDQDTVWDETIELHEDINTEATCCSTYRITCTHDSYICEFQRRGIIEGNYHCNATIGDCLMMMGLGASDVVEIQKLKLELNNLLELLRFPGRSSKSMMIKYQSFDSSLMDTIGPKFSEKYAENGFAISSPHADNMSLLEEYSNTEMGVKVGLQSFTCFVAVQNHSIEKECVCPMENILSAITLYMNVTGKFRFYLMSNYVVRSTIHGRTWSRTKCRLTWVITRANSNATASNAINNTTFNVYGVLIRNSDNAQLAKTKTIKYLSNEYAVLKQELDHEGSTCQRILPAEKQWMFNKKLLLNESKDRKNPTEYFQNFKGMMESIGIDTSTLDMEF